MDDRHSVILIGDTCVLFVIMTSRNASLCDLGGGLKTLNLINIQTRKSLLKADFIFVTLDKSKGIH